MRLTVISILCFARLAAADPAYHLTEDAALGIALPADHGLLGGKALDGALSTCITGGSPAGSVVFWVQAEKSGQVTSARVHGSGSSALDSCLRGALGKATIADKLASSVIVVGRIDLPEKAKLGTFLPSPRVSNAAVMLDPKGAAWQLTVNRIGYTANRAADIAQAFDAQTAAIAACGAKLAGSPKDTEIHALAFSDGHAIVRGSGAAGYDSCLEKVLDAIKLPAPESALWLEPAPHAPAEALAPRK